MDKHKRSVQDMLIDFGITSEEAQRRLNELENYFKEYPFKKDEVDHREFVNYLSEMAEKRDGEEYNLVKSSAYFTEYFNIWHLELLGQLAALPESILRDNFVLRTYVIYKAALKHAAYFSANEPVVTQFVLARQAKRARATRKQKSEERALDEAISAALKDASVARPYKQAISILPEVNQRLSDSGFSAISVDKVYRRLKTRSAFLKNAEAKGE